MKIAFHTNDLNERGTAVALYDYAYYNQELLGNKSLILASAFGDLFALEKFNDTFQVILYSDTKKIQEILDYENVDIFYMITGGGVTVPLPRNVKNCAHVVFNPTRPHGDVYAVTSPWLNRYYKTACPIVPRMINLPDTDEDLREELGIPKDAIVFGRHGSFMDFDLLYVQVTIADMANRENVYFVFMNTMNFMPVHEKVFHLPKTVDMKYKTKFINTCDAMIHANIRGETFGIAIGEFSVRNKPVFTWKGTSGPFGRNHLDVLGDKVFIYENRANLIYKMNHFIDHVETYRSQDWNQYRDFTPERVMKRFEEVFID